MDEKSIRVRVVLRVFTHKIYIRTLYSRTYKQNQLFDLRGENNPTTSSDSRMRSGEHRGHRGSQGMLQYTRDGTSRSYTRFPLRLLPSDPCYCCDLMKCYARSPAITFPLHRLTPHSVGLVSRRGTSFLFDNPWGYCFCWRFCTLLKCVPISYDAYRELN